MSGGAFEISVSSLGLAVCRDAGLLRRNVASAMAFDRFVTRGGLCSVRHDAPRISSDESFAPRFISDAPRTALLPRGRYIGALEERLLR